MKKILLVLFCVLCTFPANADVGTMFKRCINSIVEDDTIWQNKLFDKTDGIFKDIGDTDKIPNDVVQSRKSQIYELIANDVLLKCRSYIADVAKQSKGRINFTHNKQKYAFDFDVLTLFDYANIKTGILVINKRNLKSGDIVKLSDLPKGEYFYSSDCSDHFIWWNLNDSSPVNLAGQAVFTEFGGSKNEFFLDFPEGAGRRAFPGLVLEDVTGNASEYIVFFNNLKVAVNKIQQFTDKLKGSTCTNQNLAAYLVVLNEKETTQDLDVFLDIKELEIIDGPYLI